MALQSVTTDGGGSRKRPAVMADVARLAGVSNQTVSRVLNDGVVAAETRARVLEAIRLLDYRPNSSARALVTGRTATIGVIAYDTTLYGPACTVHGIERAAQEGGYRTVITTLPSQERGELPRAVQRLHGQNVDGILVITSNETAIADLPSLPRAVPVIAVEAGPERGFPLVAIDQRAGAAAATEHLLGLGHRTVIHLAGPTEHQEAAQRVEGWRTTLLQAGAEVREPVFGDWSARSGYEVGSELLAGDGAATAVFVANDQMALGLLRAAAESGRRVPEDLSVVGFDDIPEAPFLTPPLTTIRQPFRDMGRDAFAQLRDQLLGGSRTDDRTLLKPELVVRSSTAAPAA